MSKAPPWPAKCIEAAYQIHAAPSANTLMLEKPFRYIAEHFQPSKKRNVRSIYALKHDFERAETRYITEDDYTECLRQCGFKVIDGKVFAEEIEVM